MDAIELPDLSDVRGSYSDKELPPQASAEDTSNWDNRTIALPNPKRPLASFARPLPPNYEDIIFDIPNPYLEQERLKSAKNKK